MNYDMVFLSFIRVFKPFFKGDIPFYCCYCYWRLIIGLLYAIKSYLKLILIFIDLVSLFVTQLAHYLGFLLVKWVFS